MQPHLNTFLTPLVSLLDSHTVLRGVAAAATGAHIAHGISASNSILMVKFCIKMMSKVKPGASTVFY